MANVQTADNQYESIPYLLGGTPLWQIDRGMLKGYCYFLEDDALRTLVAHAQSVELKRKAYKAEIHQLKSFNRKDANNTGGKTLEEVQAMAEVCQGRFKRIQECYKSIEALKTIEYRVDTNGNLILPRVF